jgi:hypothetical protein
MIATLSLGFVFDRAAAFFRTYMGSLKSSTNHEAILFFLAVKTGGWVKPSPVAATRPTFPTGQSECGGKRFDASGTGS